MEPEDKPVQLKDSTVDSDKNEQKTNPKILKDYSFKGFKIKIEEIPEETKKDDFNKAKNVENPLKSDENPKKTEKTEIKFGNFSQKPEKQADEEIPPWFQKNEEVLPIKKIPENDRPTTSKEASRLTKAKDKDSEPLIADTQISLNKIILKKANKENPKDDTPPWFQKNDTNSSKKQENKAKFDSPVESKKSYEKEPSPSIKLKLVDNSQIFKENKDDLPPWMQDTQGNIVDKSLLNDKQDLIVLTPKIDTQKDLDKKVKGFGIIKDSVIDENGKNNIDEFPSWVPTLENQPFIDKKNEKSDSELPSWVPTAKKEKSVDKNDEKKETDLLSWPPTAKNQKSVDKNDEKSDSEFPSWVPTAKKQPFADKNDEKSDSEFPSWVPSAKNEENFDTKDKKINSVLPSLVKTAKNQENINKKDSEFQPWAPVVQNKPNIETNKEENNSDVPPWFSEQENTKIVEKPKNSELPIVIKQDIKSPLDKKNNPLPKIEAKNIEKNIEEEVPSWAPKPENSETTKNSNEVPLSILKPSKNNQNDQPSWVPTKDKTLSPEKIPKNDSETQNSIRNPENFPVLSNKIPSESSPNKLNQSKNSPELLSPVLLKKTVSFKDQSETESEIPVWFQNPIETQSKPEKTPGILSTKSEISAKPLNKISEPLPDWLVPNITINEGIPTNNSPTLSFNQNPTNKLLTNSSEKDSKLLQFSSNTSNLVPASPPSLSIQPAVSEEIKEKVVIKEKRIFNRDLKKPASTDLKNQKNKLKNFSAALKSGFLKFGDILCLSSKELVSINKKTKTFTGVCIGDGISYCDLECIYKEIVKKQINNVSFRQCLFQIEPARQYGFLNVYNKYVEGKHNPQFAKILKGQADEEQDANEAEGELTFGRIVTYGERIQLRHIHSNSFVTVSKDIANEHGSLKVKLDSAGSEFSWLELLPSNKIRQEGEPVRYIDRFKISAKIEKSSYFLHMGTSLLYKKEHPCELNASDQPSFWKSKKYISVKDLEKNPLYISTGDSFRILHKDSERYLSVAPLNIEKFLPEEIKDAEGDNIEETLCIVGAPKSEGVMSRNSEVLLEKNKSSRSLWELERINPFKGGVATISEKFRLKNVSTGLYLSIISPKVFSPTFTDFITINTFELVQTNENILNFDTNIKIFQSETSTFIGLVENTMTIETYFKKNKIQKNSEFLLETFKDSKLNLQTTFVFENESEKNSSHVYQISTVLLSMLEIYKQINLWGFLAKDNGDYVLNYQLAVDSERELENCVNKGLEIMENLKSKIFNKQNQFFEDNQMAVKDSGLLDLFLKLLQLIDRRTTLPNKNIKRKNEQKLKFNMAALMKAKTESILLCPQMISKKYLHKLASKVYKILFFCIKDNRKCCKVLKNYSEFLGQQLSVYKEEVGQLLKEVFRHSNEEISESTLKEFILWTKQLRSLSKKENNYADQILILKIISSLCISKDIGIQKYQIIVEKFISDENSYFFDLKEKDENLFIKFIPINESEIEFLNNNPNIEMLYDQGLSIDEFSYISLNSLDFELKSYVCAVFNLLATIALSRNNEARVKIINHYKFTPWMLFKYIKSPSFHVKYKNSFLYLLRTLFVDVDKKRFSDEFGRIIQWNEEKNEIIKNLPVFEPVFIEITNWVRSFWTESKLFLDLGSNQNFQAKFVIQLLYLTETLIEIRCADNDFIKNISISLAFLIPNYSSDHIVKIPESQHWCCKLRKSLKDSPNTEGNLLIKVLNLLDLISRIKLSCQIEYFINLHSGSFQSNAFELVFQELSLNFSINNQSLNIYLLNLLLSHHDKFITNLAMEQLVKIFNQRLVLASELEQLIILNENEKIDLNSKIFETVSSLFTNFNELYMEFSCYQFVNKGLNSTKIQKILAKIQNLLSVLQKIMNTHNDSFSLLLAQNLCRNQNLNRILIEFLNCKYSWISKEGYRTKIAKEYLSTYRSVIMTLSSFTFQNPVNQKVIYQDIFIILSFFGNGIGISKLLSNISASQRASQKVNNVITYIFHLLSLEDKPNYSYLKILRNLVIDEKNQIYQSTQTNIIKLILKNENMMKLYLKDYAWDITNFNGSNEKFHTAFIYLLALCSSQNPFVTLQCRNLVSLNLMIGEISRPDLPWNVKGSYLIFVLNVYFINVSADVKAQYNMSEILPLLRKVVLPDLLNFKVYLEYLVFLIEKKKFQAVSLNKLKNSKKNIVNEFENNKEDLNSDEEEALKYWKYLIDIKPWKLEQATGLIMFIKELSIELKLSKFNPNDAFKNLVENIYKALEKLKAAIEGLSAKHSQFNFEVLIETIGLCLLEIPAYSYEGEEENNFEFETITHNHQKLVSSVHEFLMVQGLTLDEFFIERLKINTEIISVRSLAYKLKNELKTINLSTINSGLTVSNSEVMINLSELKLLFSKNLNLNTLSLRKNSSVFTLDKLKNKNIFSNKREEELVILITNIKENIIEKMLENFDSFSLFNFSKALLTAFQKKNYRKYLFEVFTQMIVQENKTNKNLKFKRISILQNAIEKAGIGEMALLMISETNNPDSIVAALNFLQEMVICDNFSFVGKILKFLNEPKFCFEVFSYIKSSIKDLKDLVSYQNTSMSTFRKYENAKKEELSKKKMMKIQLCRDLLHFIEQLCKSDSKEFSNYFREQNNNFEFVININLVSEIANLLIHLTGCEEIKQENNNNISISFVASQCLRTLTSLCEGPCIKNQQEIGSYTKIYRFVNWFIQDCLKSLTPDHLTYIENLKWVIKFLSSLIEGETDENIRKIILQEVDFDVLLTCCCKIHELYILGKEEQVYRGERYYDMWWLKMFESKLRVLDLFSKNMIELGFSIFNLCLSLKEQFPEHSKLESIKYYSIEYLTNNSKIIDQNSLATIAYNFYLENVSKVEINYKGTLTRLYFQVPFLTKHLTDHSRRNLIKNISNFAYQTKIEEFFRRCKKYKREMIYQQRLERYPVVAKFCEQWALYQRISFYLTCVINIILIATISQNYSMNLLTASSNIGICLYLFLVLQILFTGMGLVAYLLEYSPIIYRTPRSGNENFTALQRIEGTLLLKEINIAKESSEYNKGLSGFLQVAFHPIILYSVLHFLISFIAIQNYFWYSLLILDSVKRSEILKNVLKSITLNYKQLILTLILTEIIMYLFSVIGLLAFSSDYTFKKDELNTSCTSLLLCYVSTSIGGLSAQGGIGNAIDAPTSDEYVYRIIFDMSYFLIVIVVLLKLFFGIIINTFAELREIRQEQVRNLEETCFVCGKNKFEFQVKRISWAKHISEEHNSHAYMTFLIYIMIKKENFNGIEKYIKKQIENNEINFFPKTSIELSEFETENEKPKNYAQRFKDIEKKIEGFANN